MSQTITITIKNTENTGTLDKDQLNNIQEIMNALVSSGGLTGVKGGKTVIHFDGDAKFMGVQLDYWPFRRRKQ